MAEEQIRITITQTGARRVSKDINQIGSSASRSSNALDQMRNVLRVLAFGAAARKLVQFADGFTNLTNRIKIYTANQTEANDVTFQLVAVANKNRVAVDAIASTYQRLAISADRLGLSQERVIKITDLLSKAVVIGGSTAGEAAGALRQFSQAISADFKGAAQELNSVLEQTPGLAKALADGLGVSTDQIKKLASAGKLSSDIVIRALESQAEVLEARFAKIAPTIGQAFIVLNNSLTIFVGKIFEATGAGKSLTESIISLSQAVLRLALDEDRLNEVIDKTIFFLKALAAVKVVSFINGFIVSMGLARAAAASFIATPIARAFIAIGAAALAAGKDVATLSFAQPAAGAAALGAASLKTGAAAKNAGTALSGAATGAAVFGGSLAKIKPDAFTGKLGGMRGVLLRLSTGFVAFGAVVKTAGSAILAFSLKALSTAFRILLGPIGLIIGALFAFRDTEFQIGDSTVTLSTLIAEAFSRISGVIGAFVEVVKVSFAKAFQPLSDFIDDTVLFVNEFNRLLGEISFNSFVSGVFAAFVGTAKIIANFITRVGIALGGFSSDLISTFGKLPEALKLAVSGDFEGAGALLGETFQNGLLKQLEGFPDAAQNILIDTFQDAQNTLKAIGETDFVKAAEGRLDISKIRRPEPKPELPKEEPVGTPSGLGETIGVLGQSESSVLSLIAAFSPATAAALEFAQAQSTLAKAVKDGTINADQQKDILDELASQTFARLAAETDEVAKLQIEYNDALETLQEVASRVEGSEDQLAAATKRLKIEFEEARLELKDFQDQMDLTDGFIKGAKAGFDRFSESLGNVFTSIGDLTEGALDKGLSAIDKFVSTGELDFKGFALSVIGDIQKVITRLLILQATEAFKQNEGGLGGFFSKLLGDRLKPTGPSDAQVPASSVGPGGALTSTVGGLLSGDKISKIQKPLSKPDFLGAAAPVPVTIVSDQTGALEAVQGNADKAEAAAEGQTSIFTSIQEKLSSGFESLKTFFTELPGQITGFFTETLPDLGQTFLDGFANFGEKFDGLGDIFTAGFEGFKGLFGKDGIGGLLGGLFGGGGGGGGGGLGGLLGGGQGGGGGGGLLQTGLKLLSGFGGFGGFFADGGVIKPGQVGQSFLVGEAGPELFTPSSTGSVISNQTLAGMGGNAPPPEVNVTIVNNDDAQGVVDAMQTKEGDQVILNSIQRNRGALKQVLG